MALVLELFTDGAVLDAELFTREAAAADNPGDSNEAMGQLAEKLCHDRAALWQRHQNAAC